MNAIIFISFECYNSKIWIKSKENEEFVINCIPDKLKPTKMAISHLILTMFIFILCSQS
jgi:hypothetical protein